ncbi:RNA polymerase sigma-28 (SigD/FliA/WhiG) subunit [Scopulibacillus darangshiensis]|uniref:RNA polymerase sigma-28 (SigD/FliA/WhiG) subunit n=1 Tax=Scopulibacillus darangshiensis TaxID=442528 RepID=A0A4R2P7Q4_9BACL|nr:FliA/WhiG family RNA polymerase sigma factor [Scopulibacillus darangshiensis]TCP30308.1 RNA polymerase sigma-28 (SigD/FliA/WhiG) subunit [Scopulibacillus darangshiensis]
MSRIASDEEKVYWHRWIKGRNQEAADYLIQLYMPLVHYHVKRISASLPKSISSDDLISHGLYGLYDALEKFDESRELKFDTYASFRIRGAIIDGLRKEDWMPRSLRERCKKIEAAIEKLEQKYMRNVTLDEVAEELDLPTNAICAAVSEGIYANVLSLDDEIGHDRGDQLVQGIEDRNVVHPDESLVKDEEYQELAMEIAHLNEKEQLVISLFYNEELTLTEIGYILNLSTSRISQIHSKAIFKLRKFLTPEGIVN